MSTYKMTVAEFAAMKSKLRAELVRRSGYGSVADKVSMLDSVQNPTPGSAMSVSQGKLMDVFLQIQDLGDLRFCKEGDTIPKSFGPSMISAINALGDETMSATSSSCRGACTGLCHSSCVGTCYGCKSSCTGLCQNACTNQCVSSCTGTSLI